MSIPSPSLPTLADIEQAAARIAPYIHTTPVLSSERINSIAQCSLSFKCENLQKVGAFKARGATNAVMLLSDEQAAKGVATHSSGNHGAALAMAARTRGIPAYIVMPENAPEVKKQAVAAYGAEVLYCESTLAGREQLLAEVVTATGAHFVPPYDHHDTIRGQGTVALEILDQCDGNIPDVVIAPLGGGGLLAGVATVIKAKAPGCKIIGAEPMGADDAYQSFISGQRVTDQVPNTICDGLRSVLGKINYEVITRDVDDILRVTDEQTIAAMQLIWTRMKLVVEASAAVTLAAVLANKERFAGQNVTLILSGGNVDIERLPW